MRTVLPPAFRGTWTDAVCHVVHAPVPPNVSVPTAVPLTLTSIGRASAVPLAKPNTSVAVPAASRLTVHSSALPTALVVLQKPVPENPAWLASIAPWHSPASASNRPVGGGCDPHDSVEPVWLTRSAPPLVLVPLRTQ